MQLNIPPIIDVLYQEFLEIISFLNTSQEPSLCGHTNRSFTKMLALSIGSYFEYEVQQMLIEFVGSKTQNDVRVINFLRKKAIIMQYHTYFNWGEKDRIDKPGKNANSFFALFGEDFKNSVNDDIKSSPELDESVKAFIELGHIRNILVHSNFAAYSFDNKTTDELYNLYKKAVGFLDYLRHKLLS